MAGIFDDKEILSNALNLAATLGGRRGALLLDLLPCAGWEVTDSRFVQRVFLDALDGTPPTNLQRKQAEQMAEGLSSCAIFWESGARNISVAWPLLWKFYGLRCVIGIEQAVTADEAFARQVGAWVSALDWQAGSQFPREADALIIGGRPGAYIGTTDSPHMLTVALWEGGYLHSIDGGQPGIGLRSRALVEVFPPARRGELWLANVDPATGAVPLGPTGRPRVGRQVIGWINPERLPYTTTRPDDGENTYPDERRAA